jgi:hypothetical protein
MHDRRARLACAVPSRPIWVNELRSKSLAADISSPPLKSLTPGSGRRADSPADRDRFVLGSPSSHSILLYRKLGPVSAPGSAGLFITGRGRVRHRTQLSWQPTIGRPTVSNRSFRQGRPAYPCCCGLSPVNAPGAGGAFGAAATSRGASVAADGGCTENVSARSNEIGSRINVR